MRSTFKVLFYVNGSKEKNGIVPIMGRVTINGSVAQFSCKLTIAKTMWDAKGNRAKGKSKESRDINLALDIIKAVMTHEIADKKLAYIRDLFVFASFTALSFVDIKELTTDDIVDINGEKWILSKRHKTKVNFQLKLLGFPLQIIKRYEIFQEDKLVFPNLNYWNICKPLKKMIKECGISKDISFHCTRHGFATLALSKGVPIESVSRVLGHTNITTAQRYAKITTEKIDKELTMFGNRLNQSFSEISIAM